MVGLPAHRQEPTVGVKFISAGTAACIADIITFPLDVAKVRLQVCIVIKTDYFKMFLFLLNFVFSKVFNCNVFYIAVFFIKHQHVKDSFLIVIFRHLRLQFYFFSLIFNFAIQIEKKLLLNLYQVFVNVFTYILVTNTVLVLKGGGRACAPSST